MTTSREALSAAFDQAEAGTLEPIHEAPIDTPAPQVDPITESAAAQRARDQQGRFAQKSDPKLGGGTGNVAGSDNTVDIGDGTGNTAGGRKPPSSWKKDYWGHWERMGKDPGLQEYIEQREQDYAKGVSTYKSQWDQAQPVLKALEPFMPELQQSGITPDRWVANLGNAHRMLSLGNAEQKAQMFVKLASDYGVNLGALGGGQQNPQFAHITQTVNTLQNRIQQFESQQQEAEQRVLQGSLDSFKADKANFDVLGPTMGKLIQSGFVDSNLPLQQMLQAAYDKAIRMHDDIWQEQQALQAGSANRQTELARKRTAASSPRSASPTGAMNSGGGKKSTRDAVAEAFDLHASGRF